MKGATTVRATKISLNASAPAFQQERCLYTEADIRMIIKSTVQEVLSTILLDARGDIMGTGDIKTADLISELEYVSKSIL